MIRNLLYALAALALLLTTAVVAAQPPTAVVPVPLTYNEGRAMNQFLNSQYTYRTYSGTTPGFYYEVATPYGVEWVSRGYGYANRRITPWGSYGFEYVPPTRIEGPPAAVVTYPVPTLVPYMPPVPR